MSEMDLWQSYAQAGYDGLMELASYRNHLLAVVDHAQVGNGMRVLDAGCGTGNLLWGLHQRGIKADVHCVDGSTAMIELARQKAAQYESFGGTADVQQADLAELITKRPFDRIISSNVLYAVPEPVRIVKGLAATARAGTRLVASTPGTKPDMNAILTEHLDLVSPAEPARQQEKSRIMTLLKPLIAPNEAIVANAKYHFVNESSLRDWFDPSEWRIASITQVYGSPPQNWLVVAQRI